MSDAATPPADAGQGTTATQDTASVPGGGGDSGGSSAPPEPKGAAGGSDVPPPAAPAGPFAALSADDQAFLANKGWADSPQGLLDGYRNLEKLHGAPADKIIKLPNDPADMGEVYERLGRPAEATGYTVKVSDEHKDTVFETMSQAAFDLGLSDDQFAGMQDKFSELAAGIAQQRQSEFDDKFEQWSATNPQDLQRVAAMNQALGVSPDEMNAAINGDATAFYSVLSKVASRMQEFPAVNPDGDVPATQGFQMTGPQAAEKIKDMMADQKYLDRLYSDDANVRERAAKEKEHLHAIVAQYKTEGGSETDLSRANATIAQLKNQVRSLGGAPR